MSTFLQLFSCFCHCFVWSNMALLPFQIPHMRQERDEEKGKRTSTIILSLLEKQSIHYLHHATLSTHFVQDIRSTRTGSPGHLSQGTLKEVGECCHLLFKTYNLYKLYILAGKNYLNDLINLYFKLDQQLLFQLIRC